MKLLMVSLNLDTEPEVALPFFFLLNLDIFVDENRHSQLMMNHDIRLMEEILHHVECIKPCK